MKLLTLSTILASVTLLGACAALESSYESAMKKYDAVDSRVSDVKRIKSDIRYMKSKVSRVAGQ